MLRENGNRRGVAFIGAAMSLGQKHVGVEQAPRYFRDSQFFDLARMIDFGDVNEKEIFETDSTQQPLSRAWRIIERIRARALWAMQESEKVVVVGGDHSVAIASIQASLARDENTRVVWLDAHGDMNTPESSPTGHLHGMPLAVLMGLCENPLGGPCLKPENLFLIGIRDLDPAEIGFIANLKIDHLTAIDLRLHPDRSLNKLKRWLSASDTSLHLSFDVDSLDPSFASATGIHVANGLSVGEARAILKTIDQCAEVMAFDLVELNPLVTSPGEVEVTVGNLRAIVSELSFLRPLMHQETGLDVGRVGQVKTLQPKMFHSDP